MIEQQGRQYVLFAGLLDEAHNDEVNGGLHSIETLLTQTPDEKNGMVAIVFAQVTMDTDSEPADRRKFTGIGDASPENVGSYKQKRLIAMAETRAKARALRDAVNVGATAFEEIGESGEEAQVSGREVAQTPPTNVSKLRGAAQDASAPRPDAARKSQRDHIHVLIEDLWPKSTVGATNKILENFGVEAVAQLTRAQADDVIDWLNQKKAAADVDDESGLGQTSRQHNDDVVLDEDDIEQIEAMT